MEDRNMKNPLMEIQARQGQHGGCKLQGCIIHDWLLQALQIHAHS